MTRLLEGEVALVTGARTGLGAATVAALAGLGATVIASGRHAGDCGAVVDAVTAGGGKACDFMLDVADLDAIPHRVAEALQRYGRIDILVNNAATIAPMTRLAELDARAFDAAFTLNVSGPAALTAALWPHFGGGRIINIVSGAATRAMSGWAAYCASKAALLMLTKSIALEGEASGILGFALAPGLVDTGMQAAIRDARINAVSDIPRENLDPPERAAQMIAWLATGLADDLAGDYVDVRQPGLQERVAADLSNNAKD
ncbi:SDR family NAD(P)-dependent oxidoreductase [Mesorhizobium loti]|uniref:SDR family oxidoreductase n=1 Tax=Mesorhizobium loti R88b TaxID=935548 RepID=A0A6M7WWH7_RHILI|nr:SDR family oxidoreductase [Mesorhizobium loti]QKD05183.1 SDR family oxidoreductase [Mesorhizobium loti R88b]